MTRTTDPLLQPFRIKGLQLKNRIVSTPHAPAYPDDGRPGERYQRYHEEKARGGIGMTMFGGSSCVGPDSPSVFGQLYVGDDGIIPYFQQFAERIHKYDCGLVCQISHLGRRTTWKAGDWLPVVAPSRVREPAHRGYPKQMDADDIRRIVGYYADAARRCREGGLDGCEILSHGHLPEQFLSAATNRRTDGYGGNLDNRLRFTFEVLEAVRKAVGDDFVIGIRQGMKEDEVAGGLTLDEGVEAAKRIEAAGLVDYMTVNFGRIASDHELAHHIPTMWSGLAPWLGAVAGFRSEFTLPIIHACRIADIASARYAIEQGIIDLVGMTRAHIADPHIVNKLAAGEEDRIRPCVGAGYCLDRIYNEGEALCLHNVATGRESHLPHTIAPTGGPKLRIIVIGGGPAGLEAARVSASRGHEVILHEATDRLGGQVVLAARASWRRDLIGIVDWYESELGHLGVDVRLNSFVEAGEVSADAPDVVIVATGGVPDTDFVPGGEHCISVWDALSGPALSGAIAVYDVSGQHQAPSCADHLAGQDGTEVEFITPDRHACEEMGTINFPVYMQHFYEKGVTVTADHELAEVTPSGNRLSVRFSNVYGGPDIERLVDHLVVENGTLPADEIYQDLRAGAANNGVTDVEALVAGAPQPRTGEGYLLYRVGDAVTSRNIHAAIYDAMRLCITL